MSRGRRPEWAAVVERLDGSPLAKARLSAALEVWTGKQTAAEACLQVGLSERRFRVVRCQLLQAALAGLEPRPAGRPPRVALQNQSQLAALEATVRQLQRDLQAAQLREEIALVLPNLAQRRGRRKGARRKQPTRPKRDANNGTSGDCSRSEQAREGG